MSIIDTRLQNMRVKSANFDSNENRGSRYGAFDCFANQTTMSGGIATSELREKALQSVGRTLEIPVYDKKDITLGNVRSIVVADDENTSKLYTVTFVTYTYGFTMVPQAYKNNEFGYEEDWEAKMKPFINKLGAQLDTDCLATLAAAKTQVIADPLNYTVTADTVVAPWTERDNLLGDLEPIMESNDHYGQLHMIGNGGVKSIVNKLMQSGMYNAVNKRNEYDGKVWHFTNRLGNAAGEYANMYAVQEGSLAVLPRFSRDEIAGSTMQDGTQWGISTLPELNIPVGTLYQEFKGDYNAIAGAATADMTATWKQGFSFAVDVAYITPYNSDLTTIANPILKATVQDAV